MTRGMDIGLVRSPLPVARESRLADVLGQQPDGVWLVAVDNAVNG
jgi:hypothetical protein